MLASAGASAGGTVQGTIRAQDTGQPLVGATVTVCTTWFDSCFPDGGTISDANGHYVVSGILDGGVYIGVRFQPGQANYVAQNGALDVAEGSVQTVDFALVPGASIGGTVRGAGGQPLANVALELDTAQRLGTSYSVDVARTTSSADGSYTFTQLPADSYVVQTTSRGATPYRDQFYAGHKLTPPSQGDQAADVIAVAAGQSVGAVDFSLDVGGRIVGTLTDRYTSGPIANAPQVTFFFYDTATGPYCCLYPFDVRVAATDALGHFELDGVTDAPFFFAASSYLPQYSISYVGCTPDPCGYVGNATRQTVAPGATATLDLSLFPGSVVTGTVTRHSDGQPLAGVVVSAYLEQSGGIRAVFATASTDALGHYSLTGDIRYLNFGVFGASSAGVTYLDQVYAQHDCQFGSCFQLADSVETPEYQVTPNIDFALDPGASIGGQVVTQDTQQGIAADVFLYKPDGSLSIRLATSPDGTFRTGGLQAGSYYFAAYRTDGVHSSCTFYGDVACACDNGFCDLSKPAPPGAQPVVVATDDVHGIVIRLPYVDRVFGSGFD